MLFECSNLLALFGFLLGGRYIDYDLHGITPADIPECLIVLLDPLCENPVRLSGLENRPDLDYVFGLEDVVLDEVFIDLVEILVCGSNDLSIGRDLVPPVDPDLKLLLSLDVYTH